MTDPKPASPTPPEETTLGAAMVPTEAEAIDLLADLLFELWREDCLQRRKEQTAA